MSWQNNWNSMQQPSLPHGYPPPMPGAAPPMSNYGQVNSDQYNQWQWQQYQQQYAQWYAMYGEKYAQQTGSALPPVPSPMPQGMQNAVANPYGAAPLPTGSAFGSLNVGAPPPPSEPHPDELRMSRDRQKPPLPEDKSPEEIAFDEQFRKWEEEFETWKRTNINHPDKAAYREYEQKYEDQRKKLLDHREQLKRKRTVQKLPVQAAVSSAAVSDMSRQPPPPPPSQPVVGEYVDGSSAVGQAHIEADSIATNMQNVFNSPGGSRASGGIPGLDLIDENPTPLPKKIKLEENVIDLADEENENLMPNMSMAKSDNMISSLLNDPNVNALLQLVGKTMAGNGSGGAAAGSSSANPLVAALAQLTSTANPGNSAEAMQKLCNANSSLERRANGNFVRNEERSNTPRLTGTFVDGPSPQPSPSGSGNYNLDKEEPFPRQAMQNFNPHVPPPLLDVDLSQPPPFMRQTKKPPRDRWNSRNSDHINESGPFNGGYSGDGSPLAKMPRFDRPPPHLVERRNELQIDPELGRPVAVPKPEWMTEDQYQEIYDRYEHVRSFDERKNKMELAIQVLRQTKTREEMPKPLPMVKTEIKSEPVDDYFQPQQVFDYSNCRNTRPFASNQLPAGRVIDYGHRGATPNSDSTSHLNNNRRDGSRQMNSNTTGNPGDGRVNGFVPNTQRFDYNHSRMASVSPSAPSQQSHKWPQASGSADRSGTGLERLAQMHLNPNPKESNPNYPSKFLLMNDNRPNCISTKRGKRPSSIRKQKLRQMQQEIQTQQPEQNVPLAAATDCKQETELALEDLSSDDEALEDDREHIELNMSEDGKKQVRDDLPDERPESAVSSLSSQNHASLRMIDIGDLLFPPARFSRPPRICLLIRGLPGSGKSHLARLIKSKEQSFGPSPRVLSLDDYFLVDADEEEKDPVTGKLNKITRSQYEFDAEMEDIYIQNLIKAFKRTISERLFNFVIVDCCNHRLETYCEFHNYARSNGFKVYTCTMQTDVEVCARQNIHNRTESEIQVYADSWAMAPEEHVQINFGSLLEPEQSVDTDTTVADMELAANDEDSIPEMDNPQSDHDNASQDGANDDSAEGTAECDLFASKWDHDSSEQNLARLDGISKPLRRPPTLEAYLQLDNDDSDDDNDCQDGVDPARKKKRVRWADVEEQKAQKRMRQLGFVVGVTDWSRMMDPTEGSSALTQTKYIARVKKQP